MNKNNKIFSVSTILSLLISLIAAIVVWLFAKYNSPAAEALVSDFVRLIV